MAAPEFRRLGKRAQSGNRASRNGRLANANKAESQSRLLFNRAEVFFFGGFFVCDRGPQSFQEFHHIDLRYFVLPTLNCILNPCIFQWLN